MISLLDAKAETVFRCKSNLLQRVKEVLSKISINPVSRPQCINSSSKQTEVTVLLQGKMWLYGLANLFKFISKKIDLDCHTSVLTK